MSKRFKKTLIIISTVLIILIAGGYHALKIFGEAFGADCQKSQNWTVQNYTIEEYKCLGWAGPPYYPLYLYKNGEEISSNGHKLDSCTYQFSPRRDLKLLLNVCNNQITEIKPAKRKLKLEEVDSILMISKQTKEIRKLSLKKFKIFIEDWNKSKVSDYRNNHKDSLFFPDYDYRIKVYEKDSIFEFITGNFLIGDNSKWIYYMAEDSDLEYFKRLWN